MIHGVGVLDGYTGFGAGSVLYGSATTRTSSFVSDGKVSIGDYPVCPVVSLKAEIPAKMATPNF